MKNKTVVEYESKRWYRVLKSLYIALFAITLLIANLILLDSFEFLYFLITNVIIVFVFGTIEGLFWYIARGKWGYPKDEESVGIEKVDSQ